MASILHGYDWVGYDFTREGLDKLIRDGIIEETLGVRMAALLDTGAVDGASFSIPIPIPTRARAPFRRVGVRGVSVPLHVIRRADVSTLRRLRVPAPGGFDPLQQSVIVPARGRRSRGEALRLLFPMRRRKARPSDSFVARIEVQTVVTIRDASRPIGAAVVDAVTA